MYLTRFERATFPFGGERSNPTELQVLNFVTLKLMSYFQILIIVYISFLIINTLLKIKTYPNAGRAILFSVIFLILGYVWDAYCVSHGDWTFSNSHILGIWIGGLPLEEYLFFVIVPYGCISVYKIVNEKFIK